MTTFTHKDSLRYWYAYKDPAIYRVITFMESVEKWTLDDNEKLEATLKMLGEAMEDITSMELDKEDEFVTVLAYLKSSRTLHILQLLNTACAGSAAQLVVHAKKIQKSEDATPEAAATANLFLRRHVVFERLRLLSRVFSQERFELVQRTLEHEETE